jgi:hypothetical protein
LNVAKEADCDLIVMATHGRTGLQRLLMGSVTEEVVRKAVCPVWTLNAEVASDWVTKVQPASSPTPVLSTQQSLKPCEAEVVSP